jgi:hypothetical protein
MEAGLQSSGVWVDFSDWTRRREVQALGTNAGAAPLPFQGWRRFKEAFAPELVEKAIVETQAALGRPLSAVLDPFGGSGTTALAAQFLGVRPITIEVNPFLADLIEAKIARYDLDKAGQLLGQVVEAVAAAGATGLPFPGAPATFVEPGVDGRFIFSRAVAARLAAYRDAINTVEDRAIRRLFHIILASTAIPVSNVVVSGKGRRYRRSGGAQQGDPHLVNRWFEDGILAALHDLQRYEARRCRDYTVFRGDARTLIEGVGPIDVAVFSPPYPNSFDYTDVYNVELWVLGYLTDAASNRSLREATLRSHVQIFRDLSASQTASAALKSTVDQLQQLRGRLWNPHIPEMIGAYADDMRRVLRVTHSHLAKGGRVYMVVGDSRYAGVDVPVARILVEEAPALGYHVLRSEPFRSMRASPQQGGRAELVETLIVLEA